jgi:hypothetical protein
MQLNKLVVYDLVLDANPRHFSEATSAMTYAASNYRVGICPAKICIE